MRQFFFTLFLITLVGVSSSITATAFAQSQRATTSSTLQTTELEILGESDLDSSSPSATATASTELASPAADVAERIRQRTDADITATGGEKKSELARFLDEHPISGLTWNNFLQHAIRGGIDRGLPANTVVLLLLFPVIASIIAFSKHIIGLKGFGVYIPAVLSVAFVSTGLVSGVFAFTTIMVAAILMRLFVRKFRLPYLPRTATLLLGVSIIFLSILLVGSYFGWIEYLTLSIFPLLIMMLLMENFMESQLFNSQSTAMRLSIETLLIALVCSLVIASTEVQRFVLLNPEVVILAVGIINYLIGRYTGLRLLEYIRFKNILEQ